MDAEFWDMKKEWDDDKQKRDDRYMDISRQKLCDLITKHLRTVMIGALADFEEAFGKIWGHNSDQPLTEQQKRVKNLWDETRSSVLDRGNAKIRHVEAELSLYDVKWNKYVTQFKVKGRK